MSSPDDDTYNKNQQAARDQNSAGNSLARQGRFDEAMPYYQQAVTLDPNCVEAHNNLGNILRQKGKIAEAAACYERATIIKPDFAMAHNNLGIVLRQLGQSAAAIIHHRHAIAIDPRSAEAHFNLGNVLADQEDLSPAIDCYRLAISLNPGYAAAYMNLGNALRCQSKFAEAIESYKRAIAIRPNYAEAYHNLGSVLLLQNSLDQAVTYYRQAVALEPRYAEAHFNLGNALKLQSKYDAAKEAYEYAIDIRPNYAEAHHNLGNTLLLQNRPVDAAQSHRSALALNPDSADAYTSLGHDLASIEEHEGALDNYNRALSIRPDYAEAHDGRAHVNLRLGNFSAGWPEYEWRWHLKDLPVVTNFSMPLWDGKDLHGKTILLYCEQGYGDSIQFIRYAPMVKEKGSRVFLLCPKPLVRLFQNVKGIDQVIPEGMDIPECDSRSPLLSLPLIFGTELETIPSSIPYISAPPDQVALWAERMRPYKGLKVGLVWAGSLHRGNAHQNSVDARRSMRLEQFAPLENVSENIHFFSLQKGDQAKEVRSSTFGLKMIDFMGSVEDFAATAALVVNLDLVIGVDTSVIHLAGAIGKPVWVLSRFAGCWRWLLNREDSPWYPTLRIFRQTEPGNWSSVVENVCAELRHLKRVK